MVVDGVLFEAFSAEFNPCIAFAINGDFFFRANDIDLQYGYIYIYIWSL